MGLTQSLNLRTCGAGGARLPTACSLLIVLLRIQYYSKQVTEASCNSVSPNTAAFVLDQRRLFSRPMVTSCGECGGDTIWDDDVGTAICTTCGTLVDPSQSILTSQVYQPDESHQFNPLWDPSSAHTLKSFRTGSNWDLAGQGKEARDRKNTVCFFNMSASSLYRTLLYSTFPRCPHFF